MTIKQPQELQYYDNKSDDETFRSILAICIADSDLNDKERLDQRARVIATVIFEMNEIFTGKVSWGFIDVKKKEHKKRRSIKRKGTKKKLSTTPPTREHFHGRQAGGEALLAYVKAQGVADLPVDPIAVRDIVDFYRHVHYTSSKENTRLGKHAKKFPETSWEQRYAECGVELTDQVKGKHYHTYRRPRLKIVKLQPIVHQHSLDLVQIQ